MMVNNITIIFNLGVKKYKYFLDNQHRIDDYYSIKRDEKEIVKKARFDYFIYKVLFLLIVIMISLVLIALIYSLFCQKKTVDLSEVEQWFSSVNEAWLSFWGNVFGSAITVFGVYISIKYDLKQQEKKKIQQSLPIIIIETNDFYPAGNDEATVKIDFKMEQNKKNSENIEIPILRFSIRNLGFNAATNISLSLILAGYKFEGFSEYVLMKKEEIINIYSTICVDRNIFFDIVSRLIKTGKPSNEFRKNKDSCNIGEVNGFLRLKYNDVYQNEICRRVDVKILFLKKESKYIADLKINNSKSPFFEVIKF